MNYRFMEDTDSLEDYLDSMDAGARRAFEDVFSDDLYDEGPMAYDGEELEDEDDSDFDNAYLGHFDNEKDAVIAYFEHTYGSLAEAAYENGKLTDYIDYDALGRMVKGDPDLAEELPEDADDYEAGEYAFGNMEVPAYMIEDCLGMESFADDWAPMYVSQSNGYYFIDYTPNFH